MKMNHETITEAMAPLSDRKLTLWLLKKYLTAILPFSLSLFIASRVNSAFIQFPVLLTGVIWAFAGFEITKGALCRAIYLKTTNKSRPDFAECDDFAMGYAPAYLLIPLSTVMIILFSNVILVAVFSVGSIEIIGELIVSTLFVPIIITAGLMLVFFTGILFYSPAIIAIEEKGIKNSVLGICHHIKTCPLKFFIMLLFSMILIALFSIGVSACFMVVIPFILSTGRFVLGEKITALIIVLKGFLFNGGSPYITHGIPFTYQLSALVLYIFSGVLLSMLIVFPSIFSCSLSVFNYLYMKSQFKANGNSRESNKNTSL